MSASGIPSGLVLVENAVLPSICDALGELAGDLAARRLVLDAGDLALVGELRNLRVVDASPARRSSRWSTCRRADARTIEADDHPAASSGAGRCGSVPVPPGRGGRPGGSGGRHWSSGPGLICTPSRSYPMHGAGERPCYGAAADVRIVQECPIGAMGASIALPGGSHVAGGPAPAARAVRACAGAWRLLLGLLRGDPRRSSLGARSATRSRRRAGPRRRAHDRRSRCSASSAAGSRARASSAGARAGARCAPTSASPSTPAISGCSSPGIGFEIVLALMVLPLANLVDNQRQGVVDDLNGARAPSSRARPGRGPDRPGVRGAALPGPAPASAAAAFSPVVAVALGARVRAGPPGARPDAGDVRGRARPLRARARSRARSPCGAATSRPRSCCTSAST